MNTLEAIYSRRSIRAFSAKEVDGKYIEQLIKAAMYAPSARNTQSWSFIVVNQKERLEQLSDIHPYAKMLKSASAAILVCGDLQLEESLIYQIQNCSAATQNILLAAHEMDLGAVWLGIQPREDRIIKMIDFFKLPSHIVPITLVAIGHKVESPPIPERNVKDKLRYDVWGD